MSGERKNEEFRMRNYKLNSVAACDWFLLPPALAGGLRNRKRNLGFSRKE
ncbi:hypothetical protein [Cognataquiflexum aquatile]|nr:hypothetical protein [Cognataquiflexum aquatile]